MKTKNAFTLIEVLAVIVLISLLSIVALPPIINQVNKSRGKLDESLVSLIKEAASNYLDMNQSSYPKKEGNVYCVKLQTLVDSNYLKSPLKNPSTKEDIDLNQYVEATFISSREADYKIAKTCTKNIISEVPPTSETCFQTNGSTIIGYTCDDIKDVVIPSKIGGSRDNRNRNGCL